MRCVFGTTTHKENDVSLKGQVVPRKEYVSIFRTMLQRDGDINDDVSHIIKLGWRKWCQASGSVTREHHRSSYHIRSNRRPIIFFSRTHDRIAHHYIKKRKRRSKRTLYVIYGVECWIKKDVMFNK
jgi:hypothetical protein